MMVGDESIGMKILRRKKKEGKLVQALNIEGLVRLSFSQMEKLTMIFHS